MRTRERVDSQVIELDRAAAIRRYTRAFGCTEQQLRAAVALVGCKLSNVRMRFRRRAMLARRHRG